MINFFYNLNPATQALIGGIFTLICTTIGASSVFVIKKPIVNIGFLVVYFYLYKYTYPEYELLFE